MFRYIGNKTKLLPNIIQAIRSIVDDGSTICDLMAGTGSVSLELRRRGYRVIASDMMTYSYHHLNVLLKLSQAPVFDSLKNIVGGNGTYQNVLRYLNSLAGKEGYFFTEFSPEGKPKNGSNPRKYFTSDNAKKIDAIRDKINEWDADLLLTPLEKSVLLHTLILSTNDVANISGTYGYFLSHFSDSSKEAFVLKPCNFYNYPQKQNEVLLGKAEEIAPKISCDVCYIDPPYTKRQYAANYHILETLARGDYPEAVGKSGLRNWWDQHSSFCTKTKIFDSFAKVFQMNCSNFIISYSEDGLIPLDKLVDAFRSYGEVSVETVKYKRFRSNNSQLPTAINEYLILVRR